MDMPLWTDRQKRPTVGVSLPILHPTSVDIERGVCELARRANQLGFIAPSTRTVSIVHNSREAATAPQIPLSAFALSFNMEPFVRTASAFSLKLHVEPELFATKAGVLFPKRHEFSEWKATFYRERNTWEQAYNSDSVAERVYRILNGDQPCILNFDMGRSGCMSFGLSLSSLSETGNTLVLCRSNSGPLEPVSISLSGVGATVENIMRFWETQVKGEFMSINFVLDHRKSSQESGVFVFIAIRVAENFLADKLKKKKNVSRKILLDYCSKWCTYTEPARSYHRSTSICLGGASKTETHEPLPYHFVESVATTTTSISSTTAKTTTSTAAESCVAATEVSQVVKPSAEVSGSISTTQPESRRGVSDTGVLKLTSTEASPQLCSDKKTTDNKGCTSTSDPVEAPVTSTSDKGDVKNETSESTVPSPEDGKNTTQPSSEQTTSACSSSQTLPQSAVTPHNPPTHNTHTVTPSEEEHSQL